MKVARFFRPNTKYRSLILLSFLFIISCSIIKKGTTLRPYSLKQKNMITIENGNLKAVFVNNTKAGPVHEAGYNGIAELYHSEEDSNIFVPFYSGFNLEFIFGGDSLARLFEPRKHPMTLFRKSDNEVLLYQEPTPLSGVESLTEFKVVNPHYIDITFRCKFHNEHFFQHGYAGLFWASYINKPEDKKIYFRGMEENKTDTAWIAAYSEKHGLHSTHRNIQDDYDLFFAGNFNVRLANHYSVYRYALPFYFGRFHKMVLAYFFESNEIIRFSQSPDGGGDDNPAWDFQYIIPDPKIGQEYSFKVRMIYKPFISEKDLYEEYENWKAKH